MPSPIRITTVAELIAHDHSLRLYCPHCDRWAQAPLEKLAARGRANIPIQRLRFRCVMCGTPARMQLRPPEIPPASGTGWMENRGTIPWNNSGGVFNTNQAVNQNTAPLK